MGSLGRLIGAAKKREVLMFQDIFKEDNVV
jgi:hypothetical protein